MNKWIGTGRLTRDAEIKYFQSGKPYATFTMAVPDPYAREGEPDADFIDCIVYDKRKVELIEKYVRKGTKLEIIGRLKSGSYAKGDGSKVYYTEFVCEEFIFCGKKEGNGTNMAAGEESAAPSAGDGFMNVPDGIEDELPFK